MTTDFEILVYGTDGTAVSFTEFTSGWVRSSLDKAADSFEFNYADLRLDLDDPVPVEVGDSVEIKLEKKLILTGYIDDVSVRYDASTLRLTCRGRSKTGDLVDCSAIKPGSKSGKWSGATVERIAKDICAPFGIQVEVEKTEDSVRPFAKFAIQHGERAIDCIKRAAKKRALHAYSDEYGKLIIGTAGSKVVENYQIEYGINVIVGERYETSQTRHSSITMRAQVAGTRKDGKRVSSSIVAEVQDDAVDRYRPLLMVTTGQGGREGLKKRAIWERNKRAGMGERLIYKVDGYGHPADLWRKNVMTRAVDPRANVLGMFLVIEVVWKFSAQGADGGRVTDLTLGRKNAYMLEAEYPKRKRSATLEDSPEPPLFPEVLIDSVLAKKRTDHFLAPYRDEITTSEGRIENFLAPYRGEPEDDE